MRLLKVSNYRFLYAYSFSTAKRMRYHELYDPLTRWKIKQARKHAIGKEPGIPQEKNRPASNSPSNGFVDFVNTSTKMWLMVEE